jgi:hypothetical protein
VVDEPRSLPSTGPLRRGWRRVRALFAPRVTTPATTPATTAATTTTTTTPAAALARRVTASPLTPEALAALVADVAAAAPTTRAVLAAQLLGELQRPDAPAAATWAHLAPPLIEELLEHCTVEGALRLLEHDAAAEVAAVVVARGSGVVGVLGAGRLQALLTSDDPRRRAVGIAAIDGDPRAARRDLRRAAFLAESPHDDVRAALVRAFLRAEPGEWNAARLAMLLDATADDVRDAGLQIVAGLLPRAPLPFDVPTLIRRLDGHDDPRVRRLVAALGRDLPPGAARGGDRDARPPIDDDARADDAAARALARTARRAAFAADDDADVAVEGVVARALSASATTQDGRRALDLLADLALLACDSVDVDGDGDGDGDGKRAAAVARVYARHPALAPADAGAGRTEAR